VARDGTAAATRTGLGSGEPDPFAPFPYCSVVVGCEVLGAAEVNGHATFEHSNPLKFGEHRREFIHGTLAKFADLRAP
jgi:hypothetical protein